MASDNYQSPENLLRFSQLFLVCDDATMGRNKKYDVNERDHVIYITCDATVLRPVEIFMQMEALSKYFLVESEIEN